MSGFDNGIEAARAAGHVNLHGDARKEVMELSAASKEEKARHAATILSFEVKKRARSVMVPTAVEEIMDMLRRHGEPITLFGEGPYDRRERLRERVAALEMLQEEGAMEVDGASAGARASAPSSSSSSASVAADGSGVQKDKEEFVYTVASEELVSARQLIADFSFARAQERLHKHRELAADSPLGARSRAAEEEQAAGTYAALRGLSLQATADPEPRPLVKLRCAPRGDTLATGSLGCHATIWAARPEIGADGSEDKGMRLQPVASLLRDGHRERLMALSWQPQAYSAPAGAAMLATAGADGRCMLWDCRLNDAAAPAAGAAVPALAPVRVLEGHSGQVTDCEFHPSGATVLTAGMDYSWRMWDAETGACLLLQDGHTKDCSALAVQPDGALVMTCDAGGVVLTWDLRSGQRVASFPGHVEKVTSCSFSPNGFTAATASVDNMVRVWDLRSRRCSYMLPAHSTAITCARYNPSGEALLTTSFDGTVKVWSARDHGLLSTLEGHHGKVMAADFLSEEAAVGLARGKSGKKGAEGGARGGVVASAGFDRTVKLWK